MLRSDTLRTFGDAERADPSDETIINGTPYWPGTTGRNAVGRLTYREEYMRDYAQDLDEWLDGDESRH